MGGDCLSVSDHFQRAEFQFFLVLSSYSWLLLYLVLLPLFFTGVSESTPQ